MLKIGIVSIFCMVMQMTNGKGDGLLKQRVMLERLDQVETAEILSTVTKDLLSEDALEQDAGSIILLKLRERLKAGDRKAQSLFDQLAQDRNVVNRAADIIESRLLGWYNRQNPGKNTDDMELYLPLFSILGKADNKTARGTLVRSMLYLQGRKDVFDLVSMNEELVALLLKRLDVVKQRLCCLYPGKDFVVEMLEKDLRGNMLDAFANALEATQEPGEKLIQGIKKFIVECMEYGDSKNGSVIRIKAVQIAGVLGHYGEKDLVKKIEDLSKNDPYYVHKYDDKTGYSMTELQYPVREMSLKILLSRK
jgi:hypothetical protein